MTAPSKRRWFRFGLRTMFVAVTLAACVCGYIMWQWRIVQERKAVLAESNGERRFLTTSLEELEAESRLDHSYEYARVSHVRRLIGDKSFVGISFPANTDPTLLERAEIAFPESSLIVDPHWSGRCIASRDSLHAPADVREPNRGTLFKTGLIEK